MVGRVSSSPTKRLRIRLKSADREQLALDFGARIRLDGLLLPPRRDIAAGTLLAVELQYHSGEPALSGQGRVRAFPGLATVVDMVWDEACHDVLLSVVKRAGQLAASDTDDLPVAPNTEDVLPVDQIDTEDVPRMREAAATVDEVPVPADDPPAASAPTVVEMPAPAPEPPPSPTVVEALAPAAAELADEDDDPDDAPMVVAARETVVDVPSPPDEAVTAVAPALSPAEALAPPPADEPPTVEARLDEVEPELPIETPVDVALPVEAPVDADEPSMEVPEVDAVPIDDVPVDESLPVEAPVDVSAPDEPLVDEAPVDEAPQDEPLLSASASWADAMPMSDETPAPFAAISPDDLSAGPDEAAPAPTAADPTVADPSGMLDAITPDEVEALQADLPPFDEEPSGNHDLPPPPDEVDVGPGPDLGAGLPDDLRFEPPVEEDGTPSEDLLVLPAATGDLIDDPGPPEEHIAADLSLSDDLEEVEPMLLEEVVEEPPGSGDLPPDPRTQYAYGAGARDELGPSPAPSDALSFEVAKSSAPPPPEADDRDSGEVTPLARIELVRRAASVFRAGSLAPPPLEVAAKVPPTAIPSKRNRPVLPPPSRRVLGIDPGDETTRAAIVDYATARVLPSRRGARGVPSAVFIDPSGKTIVGEPAARKLAWQPEQGISGTKRLVGRLYCSPYVERVKVDLPCHLGAAEEDEAALSIGEHFISLEEIEALVLKEARASAEFALQDQANRAVLLCPSHFGVRQRQALRVAARLAGLHAERILSTPLAVVLGQLRGPGLAAGNYLVCDVGASGCDVAVVAVGSVEARVLACAGGPGGGGRDFDRALADRVLEEVERSTGVVPGTRAGLADVMQAVEVGKWSLSQDTVTRVHVEHPPEPSAPPFTVEVEIRREEAEARFAPLVELIVNNVQAALLGSGVDRGSLAGTFLIGGQSKAPVIRRAVAAVVGDALIDVDGETAAVQGAAWAGAQLESTAPYNLHEILPATLSVGRREGHTQPILATGTAVPARGRVAYPIEAPEDRHLFLFQGDHGHVETDEPVGRFRIPDRFEGAVELELELSMSGLLVVRVADPVTGETEVLTEVADCSRPELRAHFGTGPHVPVATPPHGLFARLLRALSTDDEISAG